MAGQDGCTSSPSALEYHISTISSLLLGVPDSPQRFKKSPINVCLRECQGHWMAPLNLQRLHVYQQSVAAMCLTVLKSHRLVQDERRKASMRKRMNTHRRRGEVVPGSRDPHERLPGWDLLLKYAVVCCFLSEGDLSRLISKLPVPDSWEVDQGLRLKDAVPAHSSSMQRWTSARCSTRARTPSRAPRASPPRRRLARSCSASRRP